jgi:hypothetical protein
MAHPDRGQAAVLVVLAATALFVAIVTALVLFGGRLVDRTRAQTAADAAALASLEGGRAAAEAIAARHGAVIVSFRATADTVTVMLAVDGEQATARATDAPPPSGP